MIILPAINIETFLVILVSYAVPGFGTKHHLTASHIIEHYVFKSGFLSFIIYSIKVDLLLRHYLNPDIALNEIKLSSFFYRLVYLPFLPSSFLVCMNLEEEDVTGRTDDESFIENQIHLTQYDFWLFLYNLFIVLIIG